jgi:hypothetical protein
VQTNVVFRNQPLSLLLVTIIDYLEYSSRLLILLDSTVDLLCILETMFQVFGIVERIHVGGDPVHGGHRANGPGPDGRSVDQLFGKRLDPRQKDILFMRTQVLGHLESKEKGIRCEQSV